MLCLFKIENTLMNIKKGYRLARATSEAQAMDKVADYMLTVENVHYIDYLEASKVID